MSAVPANTTPPVPQRLPWPFVGSALVAMTAVYISGDRFLGVAVLAALLLGTYATRRRLPANKVIGWTLRVAMWVVLILTSPERHPSGISILYEQSYIHLFGYLCAGEIVLRAWTRSPFGPSRGEAMLLAALVFTAATNTYDRVHIHALAPVYAAMVVLSARSFGGRGLNPVALPTRRPALVVLRTIAILLAVGLGSGGVYLVNRYEYRITAWAVELTRNRRPKQTEVGLNASPRLQSVFNPTESMGRVLLIEGPPAERHLRVLAFDTYDGRLWRPALTERRFEAVSPDELRRHGPPGQPYRFSRVGDTFDLLPVPLEAAAVTCDQRLGRDRLAVLRQEESTGTTRYEVVVPRQPAHQGLLCLPPTEEQRSALLALPPELDPRVLALAREKAGKGPAAERTVRLQQYLRANHAYSLSFEPSGEPLNDFILNRRAAHCQYFASALVMMARAAGVPARMVTGYYAHERFGDGAMIVRDRDAHAWAECWIDGAGWVTADATPSGGRPSGLFDRPSRWRQWWEWLKDRPRVFREWFEGLSRRALVGAAALAALIVPGIWLLRRAWPRRNRLGGTRHGDYATASEELKGVARRFERWLRLRGAVCPAVRTWRECLTGMDADERELCLEFIDTYDAARFGAAEAASLTRLHALLEALESRPTRRAA